MDAYRVTFVLALVDLVLEINRTKQWTSIRPETRASLLRLLNDLSKQLQTTAPSHENTQSPTSSLASLAESTSEPRGLHKAAGQQAVLDKATRIDPAYTFPNETSEVPCVSHDNWTRLPVAPGVAPIAGVASIATYSQLPSPGSYPRQACTQQNLLDSSDTLPPPELVGNNEISTSDGRFTSTRSGCSRPLQSDIRGPGLYGSYHNTTNPGHSAGGVTYRAVVFSNNSVAVTPFPARGSRIPFGISQYTNMPGHDGSREAEIGPKRTNHGASQATFKSIKAVIPLLDRVLVQRFKPEAKTAGGIFLPSSAANAPLPEATVIAVGPGAPNKEGKVIPTNVKTGDRVLLPGWGGNSIKVGEEEYHIFRDSEILAKIQE
ncbi:HSP10 [Sanghuangporus sanghuang]